MSSILSALVQRAQQGGASGPQQGAPIAVAGPAPAQAPGGDPEVLLQRAIDALKVAESAEPDHSDSATILKCLAALQGILATRQKNAESALGVTPAHKGMARSY